jgi:glycine dehydrogenase subunit 2
MDMGMDMNKKIRDFHQARWDEPVIFELSAPGERGVLVPEGSSEIDEAGKEALAGLPAGMLRTAPPALPEMGQMKVVKHFLRLSQENLGADFNIDIGQGTCTMKYSPKVNDRLAASPKVADLHPLQDESTLQGALEILYRTEQLLKSISGLDRFCLHPGGGSQALSGIAAIIRAWVDDHGLQDQKDEIITTIFSHPSNPAVAKLKGFKIITIYPDPVTGRPDFEAFRAAVSDRTAALMITNPEDIGLYNDRIREFTDLVHAHGGICSYDQANANGILGITRAKEAGFDLCFFNIHKTFASPHGCGGPGCGVIGAAEHLVPYLPVPLVSYCEKGQRYYLDTDLPQTVGKMKDFYGVLPAVVRAYAWIMNLGAEGLREVARVSILNNNYVFRKVLKMKGAGAPPYAEGEHRMEQVRYSFLRMKEETGIGFAEVQNRIFDYAGHIWSSHEPFIVPEPFTIEPTESYSKDELDEYLAVLERIVEEAYTDPEILKHAPHKSVIHHIDHDYLEDPARWAITWRMYKKRFDGYFQPKN